MIHAYLFVTANNKDRDGHGPEFCKHMRRINAAAGTNITVSVLLKESCDLKFRFDDIEVNIFEFMRHVDVDL